MPSQDFAREQQQFEDFFQQFYHVQISDAVLQGKKSIDIDFSLLDKFDPEFADRLLNEPKLMMEAAQNAIAVISGQNIILVPRFSNLPESQEIRIRNLRSEHIGKLIVIDGVVRRASEVRPEIMEATFECPDCGTKIPVIQTERNVKAPALCENCGRRGGKFNLIDKKLFDARWIVVEEPYEIAAGEKSSDVRIYLKNDLTSPDMQRRSDPGSRLTIVGVLKETRRSMKGAMETQMEIFVDANNIKPTEIEWEEIIISEEDERAIKEFARDPEIYQKIVASIAPSIFGLNEIKEAIAYQLFSGVQRVAADGTRMRGDIHLLLVGDPSLGKTAILKLVSKVIPRGRYVSGKGVTGVGLCVTGDTLVVLDDGSLKPIGAIVEKELAKDAVSRGEGIEVAANPAPLKILALDQTGLKIRPLDVSQYWRIKAPKQMAKVRTRSGREVMVTMDNPMPVLEEGNIVWKKAQDVQAGMHLAAPRHICVQPAEDGLQILDIIDKSAHILNAGAAVEAIVDKVRQKTTIRALAAELGISENKLYHGWRSGGNAPQLSALEAICGRLDMQLNDILPDRMKLAQWNGCAIMLPKAFNEELMYMFGLVAGDGSLSTTSFGGVNIKFCSADDQLLDAFKDICTSQLDIKPYYYKHPERVAYYAINSKLLGQLMHAFGLPSGDKSHNIEITDVLSALPDKLISAYLRGVFDTDGCVSIVKGKGSSCIGLSTASNRFVQGVQALLLRFDILSSVRERAPTTSEIRGRKVVSGRKYELEIRGLDNFRKFEERIGFRLSRKAAKLGTLTNGTRTSNTNIDVIPGIGDMLRAVRAECGMSSKELFGYKAYSYERGRRNVSRSMLQQIVSRLDARGSGPALEALKKLANSDIFWDEVTEVKVVEPNVEYVYDLTVDGEHSFVANNLIVHNTASVTKDEEFMGGWVLEAGAMVLCNKSLIAIDEFDKMNKDDQIAMHEAMSTQTISIAKASILATLPAQTSVLAGANPKHSRFDPYRPIGEQIDIGETLLSRFDLKFIMRDEPVKELDEKLATHVMQVRMSPQEIRSVIPTEFLRKYIAYARHNCRPDIMSEAAEKLKEFYINMRSTYAGQGAEIPITLRQYEALMRLAEASAKIRLSNKVEIQDAERAINIMMYSLKQIAFDIKTGKFDIDRTEGTPTSKRNMIRAILNIIEKLEKTIGKPVPLDEIQAEAENEGIGRRDLDEILTGLKRDGTLFEPKVGHLQKAIN